jgi:predicted metalloprotease
MRKKRMAIFVAGLISAAAAGVIVTAAAIVLPTFKFHVPTDTINDFASRILGSTEQIWTDVFEKNGQQYEKPVLVLYSGLTKTGCDSAAQKERGPFYCLADKKIYLDPTFFSDCEGAFDCDLARAFVITREVGHHVQNLLGILPKVQARQRALPESASNFIQELVELQADCFAGLWAHEVNRIHSDAIVEPAKIEGALEAASAWRDKLPVPPTASGSLEQRKLWFAAGFKIGTVAVCNTFAAAAPQK